ncbi:BZ3500_MvSof-1268-A1-R1_Chr8-1g09766 [Microbotryum saponariae]|uniref:BZ3500_MvSof-1268-A1-R1_Chr8-1g09766 protein n=1 Tax=Microbotryum saponariae TaxID=289078 RepID=A0A2X0MN54_9BASI|nr:BZ3500_MvSof-1268-A1-R1_Chr8-1g09766 [Microbotryum saponariae]SDA08052.1 BZ3501_MvSof-1269-A2-R1_Chr8-1g09489 [Microbotryum saponariae]
MSPSPSGLQPYPTSARASAAPPHIHEYEHDQVLGIDACIHCGDVAESSNSTQLHTLGRTAENELVETGRRYLAKTTGYVGDKPMLKGQTLKGLGADQSAYHEKKMNDTKHFIRTVLSHFEMFGLYPRVKSLFTQAKQVKKFQWGRKARLIAVACIYIAAREVKRSLRVVDLCHILDVDYHQLTRLQNNLKTLLNLKISTHEPVIFLEAHLVHLSTLVEASKTSIQLPQNLSGGRWTLSTIHHLRQVDWIKVRSLATGLLDFLTDLELATDRSPEHVACAIVIIAIEASLRTRLKCSKEIVTDLTKRVDIRNKVVLARVREIYLALTDYAKRLPWQVDLGEGKVGDVVPFVEDVVKYRKKLMDQEPKAVLEDYQGDLSDDDDASGVGFEEPPTQVEEEEEESDLDDLAPDPLASPHPKASQKRRLSSISDLHSRTQGSVTPTPPDLDTTKTHARRYLPPHAQTPRAPSKKQLHTLEAATQSLAQSLSTTTPGIPSEPSTSTPSLVRTANCTTQINPHSRSYAPHHSASIRLRHLILSSSESMIHSPSTQRMIQQSLLSPAWFQDLPPSLDQDRDTHSDLSESDGVGEDDRTTRLDKLLWEKEERDITDDELFEQGELEAFLRGSEEVQRMRNSKWFKEMPEGKKERTSDADGEGDGDGDGEDNEGLESMMRGERRKTPSKRRKLRSDAETPFELHETESDFFTMRNKKKSKLDLVDQTVLERLLDDEGDREGSEDESDGAGGEEGYDSVERALMWEKAVGNVR